MTAVNDTKRYLGALGMSLLWVFCFLFVVDSGARQFQLSWPGPLTNGTPAWGLLLERLLLWGFVPTLFGIRRPLVGPFAAVTLDCAGYVLVPAHSLFGLTPGNFWLYQVAAGSIVLAPGYLFYYWTVSRGNLSGRMALHFLYYAVLLLLVVPSVIFALTENAAPGVPRREAWLNQILFQLIFPAGILGWTAAWELAKRGDGTPMPWDPPRRLVTTGPYAYLADPLRVAKTALLMAWAVYLGNVWIAAAAMLIPLYALTFARLFEEKDLARRHLEQWDEYRQNVRGWWPRWTPWRHPDAADARLLIDSHCGACGALGQWFQGNPGLAVACMRTDADGGIPDRPMYDPGDGSPREEGIGALARALEHRNLGFAFIGWCMRMPVLRPILQIVFDAVTEKSPEAVRLLDGSGDRGRNALHE